MIMIRKLIVFSATLSFLIIATAVQAASESCQAFSLENGSMRIPVEIRGEEYIAIMTTSNIPAAISQGLVDDLGLSVLTNPDLRIVSETGPDRDYRYVADLPINLFGIETEVEELAIVNGEASYLSISLRIFNGLLLQINFPNEQLCFLSREAIDLQANQNIKMRSSPLSGRPVMSVTLNNDMDTWLDFSPGFPGGLNVDRLVARTLDLEESATDIENDSDFLNGSVNSLTFGPYELGGISARFPKRGVRTSITERQQTLTGSNIRRSERSRGSVGMEILKHFVVTMDIELERMHIFAP